MSTITPVYIRLRDIRDMISGIAREFEVKCSRNDPECHETNFMSKVEEIFRDHVWNLFGIKPSYEYKVRVSEGFIAKHYGRIDAHYGLVFFEYKLPIPGLKSESIRKDAVEKAKMVYIPGLLEDKNVASLVNQARAKGFMPQIVGIIFDGQRLIFIEYNVDTKEYRVDPETGYYELSDDTLRRIIRIVLATYKRKLDPTVLASEFGYRSTVAKKMVTVLYKKLKRIEEIGGRPLDFFNEWRKTISIAYPVGGELSKIARDFGITEENVDGVKLFFAIQTYYSLILKFLGAEVASRFYDAALSSFMDQLVKRVGSSGDLLRELKMFELGGPPRWYGIKNLLEGQLFSWYLDVWDDELYEAIKDLILKLSEFDVESLELNPEMARDVFKLLYEELVPRKEVRRKLGIYTTPDWLAELILNELGLTVENMLKLKEEKGDPLTPLDVKILDPGVGTGTFLALYIQRLGEYMRRVFPSGVPADMANQALMKITRNVVGFDIDALALMTARVNYLIALASTGLLPYKGAMSIEIPIYMANSIIPVEFLVALAERGTLKLYKVETSVKTFALPVNITPRLNELLDMVESWLEKGIDCSAEVLARELELSLDEAEIICRDFYGRLLDLKKQGRDTIWVSVVKSHLLPLRFERAFDYVVGNPPWLSYRYVADPNYQENILKPLIMDKYELTREHELVTHMEMATLFFVRSVDRFLKEGGRIGFVMPRSIFQADQHNRFRKAQIKQVKFRIDLVIDAENVQPLFYVPACAVIATKGLETSYPLPAKVITGSLPEDKYKVIPLKEALKKLNIEERRIYLNHIGKRSFWDYEQYVLTGRSDYYKAFKQGASIVPRSYWLVDVVDDTHPNIVVVKTSKRAKREESKVDQEIGPRPVERNYLYGVLTASELVPFHYLPPSIAVLPIRPSNTSYQLLNRIDLQKMGHIYMAEWLKEAEELWEKHRGEKAEKMSIYERLDYDRGLTTQNPKARYRVVYNTSGTHLVACIVKTGPLEVKGVKLNDIIVDTKLYVAHIDNEEEAHYLAAVLNSKLVDELIKPMQSKGNRGERDIHKKPLELPIPKYDPNNPVHKRLAELGRICREKVSSSLNMILAESGHDKDLREKMVLSPHQLGKLRRRVRSLISVELAEIDRLVLELLKFKSSEQRGLLRYASKKNSDS